jgi:hypothetical protein
VRTYLFPLPPLVNSSSPLPPPLPAYVGTGGRKRREMSAFDELKAKYIQGGEASPLEWAILWGAKSLSAKAAEAAAAELAELRDRIARLEAVEAAARELVQAGRHTFRSSVSAPYYHISVDEIDRLAHALLDKP